MNQYARRQWSLAVLSLPHLTAPTHFHHFQGNNWSYQYARRQWSLADVDHLRYKQLLAWDTAMMQLDDRCGWKCGQGEEGGARP